ncbi:rhomboid family intramembrane serine protease [Nocardioides sp. LHG3406-4]|uniref:rhomboid family intramembrane serine protease n=1 Tax=Nocardioides sp. LHG3406-4 TaxID=2804575 RepID=UPI003CE74BD3
MTEPTAPAGVPTCYRHPDRETYISCQRCGKSICPDCMRDAAVGFQCPDCVAEGAKSTRSGRAAYGGRRSGDPTLTSKVLIGINAAVWLLVVATGGAGSRLYDVLALLPAGRCVPSGSSGQYFPGVSEAACVNSATAQWIPGVADGAVWQLLTSAFLHVEIWHIGFNMLALWVLGPQLEAALGRARFLALYLLSALAGSTLVYLLAAPQGSTLGASGAVFGLMGGLLVLAFKVRGNVSQLLMWIGINVAITVVGRGFISWQGHLGGLVGGVLIAAIIVYAPRPRRGAVQAVGLGALTAVLAGLVVARTLALT